MPRNDLDSKESNFAKDIPVKYHRGKNWMRRYLVYRWSSRVEYSSNLNAENSIEERKKSSEPLDYETFGL